MNNGMTPYDLQTALTERLKQIFADFRLKKRSGSSEEHFRFFFQQLPAVTGYEDSDVDDPVPYTVVAISTGEIKSSNKPQKITALVSFGIWNDDPDNSGHVELLNAITRVVTDLEKNPVVGNFRQDGMSWQILTDDTAPYFYGGVEIVFEAPKAVLEDPYI